VSYHYFINRFANAFDEGYRVVDDRRANRPFSPELVFSVSALDHFIHEICCIGMIEIAKNSRAKTDGYLKYQLPNTRRFLKQPETGKDCARKRPESEHIVNQIEALRIIDDATFAAAGSRFRSMSSGDPRLKSGGKPKHLLSGQLKCAACGANYVLRDRHKYECASHLNGRACTNSVRVRKDALEEKIVRPLDNRVLEPKRVAKMVAWMRAEYARRMTASRSRSSTAPKELADLDARLSPLKAGAVADLEPDELAAAITRIEAKRRDLVAGATEKPAGRVFDMLPRAAEAFRETVSRGLAGDPAATASARLVLRPMLGPIRLEPGPNGELWANYGIDLSALVGVGVYLLLMLPGCAARSE
jgi:site-specific DNA recombinase